jgi:hypothetical protein
MCLDDHPGSSGASAPRIAAAVPGLAPLIEAAAIIVNGQLSTGGFAFARC